MFDSIELPNVIRSLLLGSVFFLWLHWLWTRRDLYRFSFNYPGFIGLPILGSILRIKHMDYFIPEIRRMFDELKRDSFCVWFGMTMIFMTRDPNIAEKVLTSPELLNKAKTVYDPVSKLLTGGLVVDAAEKWKHNRRLLNPSFNYRVLHSFIPIFHNGKVKMIKEFERLVDGKEHHLLHRIQETSIEITFETTMGLKKSSNKDEIELISKRVAFLIDKVADQLLLSVLKLSKLYTFNKKYNDFKTDAYTRVNKIIYDRQKTKSNLEENNLKTKNDNEIDIKKEPTIFLDRAINLYESGQCTIQDICSEAITIFGGAFETTALGVYSTLLMLAMHPDVQNRLFDEIISIFSEKDFEMKFEEFEHLPYLDMVISETERLLPSVPMIGRQVMDDIRITDDLTLPKNTEISISIYELHRNTEFWGPHANQFNPDNFLPENIKNRHPFAYMPFSKGARNCIGSRYALLVMKIIISGIIRNYRFSTTFKYEDLKVRENITLRFINEPKLQLHHRYK